MKRFASVLLALVMIITAFCPTAYAGTKGKILNISKDNISKSVPSTLYGLNIEDISNSIDGGLVANLVNNNSFEYAHNPAFSWSFDNLEASNQNKTPMNTNNPSYESITANGKGIVRNLGYTEIYDGSQNNYNKDKAIKGDMGFKENTKYDFGMYVRNINFTGKISVYLDSPSNSHTITQLNTSILGDKKWSQLSTTLSSNASEDGSLAIEFDGTGTILIDFVTLIPQDSYGYQTNSWKYTSLRPDLYNALLNLNPSFVRFYPYGIVKDSSLENMYSWKDTIGPVENRLQATNYYENIDKSDYYNNSFFMGMHEYLQLSADLGAQPIPVINVGMLSAKESQYSMHLDALKKLSMSDEQWQTYLSDEKKLSDKQSEKYNSDIDALEIHSDKDFDNYLSTLALDRDSDEFLNYAQDILDLIEYANGDSNTTYWGALRSTNGRKEPFGIEYIALGNDFMGDAYLDNFEVLYNLIKTKYPDIKIIACGSDDKSLDMETYKAISQKFSDVIIDEHFIRDENQFLDSDTHFESYDRQKNSIMLSSYKINSVGRDTDISNNSLKSALEEASILTSVEKNCDVVNFVAYSTPLAKINSQNDRANMLWFDSQKLVYTPNYFVNMLFSNNTGSSYIDTVNISEDIYQSVTVDEATQTIYIKLVNNGAKTNISVNLADFEGVNAVSNISLSDAYSSAYNKLNVNYIIPKASDLEEFNANGFNITIAKNSVNVIRIAYGQNTGEGLYQLPDNINYKESGYVPQDLKIGVLSVFVITVVLAISISIFMKKYKVTKRPIRTNK